MSGAGGPGLDGADIDAQASVLMQRGIRLMAEDGPGSASEALGCFDQALELRSGLPLDESPPWRYGTAACWLNRADALMRLGGPPQVAEAVRSCDQAIALLVTLPLGEDPRFPRRLSMAHHNRGLFLQVDGRRPVNEAIASFDQALAVLEGKHAEGLADRQYLRARSSGGSKAM